MITIIVLLIFGFVGYAIGRISHIIGGHLNSPHHWIYGVILIIFGAFLYHRHIGQVMIAFGFGHTISDFKDMLDLKFYGPDPDGEKKFWGID